ncbi:AroM family protein [Pantoea sp. KPR_PJ]|uniref:AroM family protein n=1 Tax=Pantoea sp. KPR_PJ TaxID=2738375 RepID=UPI0035296A68
MTKSLVTLTIGQSPRSDIMPLLLACLPVDETDHVGLLDGLSEAEIAAQFAPGEGDSVLVSRLQNGTQVRLATARVEQGLQAKISALEAEGYSTILLLCTGEFNALTSQSALLLEPNRIIPPLVSAIVHDHQVGIVVPVAEQIREQANKWRNLQRRPCFAVASPYVADNEALTDAALSLQEQGADVVVLDCIGYNQTHREFLQKLLGIPVLLSNVLVAKLAAELIV